jgi:hypothetical protein
LTLYIGAPPEIPPPRIRLAMPKTIIVHPKYMKIEELVFARGLPFASIFSLDSDVPEL